MVKELHTEPKESVHHCCNSLLVSIASALKSDWNETPPYLNNEILDAWANKEVLCTTTTYHKITTELHLSESRSPR